MLAVYTDGKTLEEYKSICDANPDCVGVLKTVSGAKLLSSESNCTPKTKGGNISLYMRVIERPVSDAPTVRPTTGIPTANPTNNPTDDPTNSPTNKLTVNPTNDPTSEPTAKPTNSQSCIADSGFPENIRNKASIDCDQAFVYRILHNIECSDSFATSGEQKSPTFRVHFVITAAIRAI